MIQINKINSLKIENIYEKIYIVFIVLSLSIIGTISYLAYLVDMPVIKLWKEIYIGIMFLFSLFLLLKKRKKKIINLIIITIFIYFIWVVYSLTFANISQVFYQIKLDLFNILFVFNTITVLVISENKKAYLNKIIKVIIVLALINSIFIIFQGLFSKFYVTKLLGIEWGAWSRKYGISIIVANGRFRCIGLMNSYVSAAELLIIATILINETKSIFKINNIKKYTLLVVFIVSIYFTTYKTAYLWLVFYFGLKAFSYMISHYLNEKVEKKYNGNYVNWYNFNLTFATILLFISQWVVTNTFIFYKLIEKISAKAAYNSIYLRVEFHKSIFNSMNSVIKKIMGLGMGVNGSYTSKVNLNGIKPIPLDSSYVYTLSNYGFIGLICYISLIAIIMFLSMRYNDLDEIGIKYLMSYLLCVQMFFNNLSTSIPTSYLVIIFIISFIYDLKKNKGCHCKKQLF